MSDQNLPVETPSEGAVAPSPTTTANPTPDNSPQPFLTVRRKGQETALSREQAQALASKGLDYEIKMNEVAAQRASVQDLLDLREAAKQDPQLRDALRVAFENPARVLAAMRGNANGSHLSEEPMDAPAADVESLVERKLRPVQEELRQVRQEKLTNAREQAIERAISSHDFLSETTAGKAFVKRAAAAELLANPSMPIDEAVGNATVLYLDAQKERQQKLLDKQSAQAPLKTQPPNVGTPPAQTSQKTPFNPSTLRQRGVSQRISQEMRTPGFMEKMFGRRS